MDSYCFPFFGLLSVLFALALPSARQRDHGLQFVNRLCYKPAFTARFHLSFLIRSVASFHDVILPDSYRSVQNIFTIELITIRYRYGTATFALFCGGWRGAALRTRCTAAARRSTRALPPDSGFGG